MRTSKCSQRVQWNTTLAPSWWEGWRGAGATQAQALSPGLSTPLLHDPQAKDVPTPSPEDVPTPSGSLLGIWLLKFLFPAAFYCIYVASRATSWSQVPSHHSHGRLNPWAFPLALKVTLIAFHLQLLHAFSH